jgi:hypothetical protein
MYSYVTETEFGSADIWKVKLNVNDAALYYLTGDGAKFMGPWLVWTAITLVLALLVGMATKYKFDGGRIVRVAAITSLMYLGVTIPQHKSEYLGVIVTCGLFIIFVEGTAFIVERLLGASKKGCLLCCLSSSWWSPSPRSAGIGKSSRRQDPKSGKRSSPTWLARSRPTAVETPRSFSLDKLTTSTSPRLTLSSCANGIAVFKRSTSHFETRSAR